MNQLCYSAKHNDDYRKWLAIYHDHSAGDSAKKAAAIRLAALSKRKTFPEDPTLQYQLADFCYECENPPILTDDPAVELQAIDLLERSTAEGCSRAGQLLHLIKKEHRRHAARGDVRSQYILGCVLIHEKATSKKAGKLLKAAADQQYPDAEYTLSRCLLGGFCGFKKDYEEAYHYTYRAFLHGQRLAAYNLGCFY